MNFGLTEEEFRALKPGDRFWLVANKWSWSRHASLVGSFIIERFWEDSMVSYKSQRGGNFYNASHDVTFYFGVFRTRKEARDLIAESIKISQERFL